jgi:hypothetical protein
MPDHLQRNFQEIMTGFINNLIIKLTRLITNGFIWTPAFAGVTAQAWVG